MDKNLHNLMKTGRVAELRNGEKYLIVRDVDSTKYGNQEWALVSNRGFRVGTSYDDTLKDNDNDSGYDVMGIYQTYNNDMTQLITTFLNIENKQHLVWERKEYHTVTFVEALQFGSANTYTYIDEQNLNLQQGDVVKVKTPISQYLVYVNNVYNERVSDEVLNKYDKVVKRIEK